MDTASSLLEADISGQNTAMASSLSKADWTGQNAAAQGKIKPAQAAQSWPGNDDLSGEEATRPSADNEEEDDDIIDGEDLREFLASLSPEELAAYMNLRGVGEGRQPGAPYHQTKSADFQSFETVANPDADITVRKVRGHVKKLKGKVT